MWQTRYALAIPKNLGVGVDFRLYSEGDFLTGRLSSVSMTKKGIMGTLISLINVENLREMVTDKPQMN